MSNNSKNKIASYSAIVGSILVNYRKSLNIGQAEASSRLSISQATLSRIERGSTAINVSQLSELADLYHISPSQILGDADEMVKELKRKGVQVSHYQKDNEAMFILGATALIGLAALIFGNE